LLFYTPVIPDQCPDQSQQLLMLRSVVPAAEEFANLNIGRPAA
jgi:hypothetical protein